jgi:hypothetical protein
MLQHGQQRAVVLAVQMLNVTRALAKVGLVRAVITSLARHAQKCVRLSVLKRMPCGLRLAVEKTTVLRTQQMVAEAGHQVRARAVVVARRNSPQGQLLRL